MPRPPFAVLLLVVMLTACGQDEVPPDLRILGGDPKRGETVMIGYGCPACHSIPGIEGPSGTVGPPLRDFGKRTYIAGVFPNRPDNLVRWLMDPPDLLPNTAMPDMNVSESDARDIAAYLYTLR